MVVQLMQWNSIKYFAPAPVFDLPQEMGDFPPLARVILTTADRNNIPGGDAIILGTAKKQTNKANILFSWGEFHRMKLINNRSTSV